jgi:hypothetical protein
MVDEAGVKIDRASKDIAELTQVIQAKRPFRYLLETNEKTGECSVYAERDAAVTSEIADIAFGVVQRLRAALDYAYWAIVSPHTTSPKEQKAVQYPFTETEARIEEYARSKFADRVSDAFFAAVLATKPHGGLGGNEHLYAVHALAVGDRHRFPTPIGEYKNISSDEIRRQVPHFPRGLHNVGFGQNGRDVAWSIRPLPFLEGDFIFKRELNVPIDVVVETGAQTEYRSLVTALKEMAVATKAAIETIRAA